MYGKNITSVVTNLVEEKIKYFLTIYWKFTGMIFDPTLCSEPMRIALPPGIFKYLTVSALLWHSWGADQR